MKDLPLNAIRPERALEISRATVELLNMLLVTTNQAKAQKLLQDFLQRIPEWAAVAELRTAVAIGLAQARMDETRPLTAQEFTELLQRSGLSQTQLGELVGAPQPNVSAWLSGSRPIPQNRANKIREVCMTAFANQMLGIAITLADSPAGKAAGRRANR